MKKITNKIANIQSTETQNFQRNAAYYNNHEKEEEEDRTSLADYKQYWQGYIRDLPIFLKRDKLRFEKGGTNNIMDYTEDKKHFTKRQWEIMQQEVKEYYNEK